MRVRAAARLHVGDVLRMRDVGDVEDADAADAVLADRILHALRRRSRCGRCCPRPRRTAGSCRPTRRSATPGRSSPILSVGRADSRCPRSGSRCSCPGSRSCRVNARSEFVLADELLATAASSRRACMFHDGLAGVHQAGLETDARIGARRGDAARCPSARTRRSTTSTRVRRTRRARHESVDERDFNMVRSGT